MSFLIDFFDRFREMALADPWQFTLLVLLAAGVGWLAAKIHCSQQIAVANQHISFLQDKVVASFSPPDRKAELKRLELEMKRQERLWDKQRGRKA
jgi:hypothetical protein